MFASCHVLRVEAAIFLVTSTVYVSCDAICEQRHHLDVIFMQEGSHVFCLTEHACS